MDQTIITCPACSRRYAVKADAISGTGRKVRCAGCGHVWVARPDTPDNVTIPAGAGSAESDIPAPPPPPPVRTSWQARPDAAEPAVKAKAPETPPAPKEKAPEANQTIARPLRPEPPAARPVIDKPVETRTGPVDARAAQAKPITPFPPKLGARPTAGENNGPTRTPFSGRPAPVAHPGAPTPATFTALGGATGVGPRPAGAPYMPRMDTPRRPAGEWGDVQAEKVEPRAPGAPTETVRPIAAASVEKTSFNLDEDTPKKGKSAARFLGWLLVLLVAIAAGLFILVQTGMLRDALPFLDKPLPGLGQSSPAMSGTALPLPSGSTGSSTLPVPSTTNSAIPNASAPNSAIPAPASSLIPSGGMPGALPAATPNAQPGPSGNAAPDVVPGAPDAAQALKPSTAN